MHSSRPNCFLVSSFEPGLELSPTLALSAPNHLLHRHTLWGISHYLKGQIISNRGPGELSALVVQDFQAAGLSTSKDFAEVPQVLCQTFRPVYKLISPCIQILAEAGDPWAGKQASRQAGKRCEHPASQACVPAATWTVQTEAMEEPLF